MQTTFIQNSFSCLKYFIFHFSNSTEIYSYEWNERWASAGPDNGLALSELPATPAQWVNSIPPYVRKFHFMYEVVRSYTKQMPLKHLSYIKETSWNTSGRTLSCMEFAHGALTAQFTDAYMRLRWVNWLRVNPIIGTPGPGAYVTNKFSISNMTENSSFSHPNSCQPIDTIFAHVQKFVATSYPGKELQWD